MFHQYPYTDFHDMNLDWIIGKIKNVETSEANTKQYAEDAEAAKDIAVNAKDDAVQAKDDAVEAKDDAVEAKDDAISFLTDTKDQLDLLQGRVDNIIPDGTQTVGNTELLDIRVGYTGEIYTSAGDAVRDQVSDLATALEQGAGWEKGGINVADGTDMTNAGRIRTSNKIKIKYLYPTHTWAALILAYSGGTYVGCYNPATKSFDTNSNLIEDQLVDLSAFNYEYRIALQCSTYGTSILPEYWTQGIIYVNNPILDDVSAKITTSLNDSLCDYYPVPDDYQLGYIHASTGAFVSTDAFTCIKIACKPYEHYKAWGYIGGSSSTAFVIFEDSNDNVIGTIGRGASTSYAGLEVVIPEGVSYVCFTTNGTNTNPLVVRTLMSRKDRLTKYKDKWVSILGDSISTFTGWDPYPANDVYDGTFANVERVSQTWWFKLIEEVGAKLLCNNAGGGSTVSGDSTYKFSNPVRCQQGLQKIVDGVMTKPDVIIVEGGINDFGTNGVYLGTWDGSQAIPSYPQYTFREAYALTLNSIKTEFPTAEVYCCTLFVGGSEAFGMIPKNNRSELLTQYNEAIREVAASFGCKIIDFDKTEITPFTDHAYTSPRINSDFDCLHPNQIGMEMLTRAALDAFLK